MGPETDLVNDALDTIGEDPIGNLFDASDARALICRRHYDRVRLRVMRGSEWNSLTQRATLAQIVVPPEVLGEWHAAYALPPDCCKVRRIVGENVTAYASDFSPQKIPFRIEGKILLCDETSCRIVYTKDQPVTPLFDAGLYDAIVSLLSSRLAAALPRDESLRKDLRLEYEADLKEALGADEDEGRDMIHTNRLRSVRF